MRRSDFIASALGTALRPSPVQSPARRLRLAIDSLGNSLDPYHDPALDVDRYSWLYGDGLTTGERSPRPSLAETPRSGDGGRTWRYVLRAARWHDRRPVRAADVVTALQHLRDMASPWLSYEPYSLIEDLHVRAADAFDVRLHRGSPSFGRTFFSPYGRPALPLLRHDDAGMVIGTGPFRLVSRLDDGYQFEAFGGSPRGEPAWHGVEVRIVPSQSTLALELTSGEADLVLPLVRGLAGTERYRLVSRHNGTIVLLFNCAGVFRTAPLRFAALRALDIDELQRTLDPGFDSRILGVLPPGAANDVVFPFPPHDVGRARAELREIRGPCTIVYVAESRRYARMALLIAQMFQAAGVTAEIVPRPQALYQAPLGPLRSGRFDLAVSGLPYDEQPDLASDWSCEAMPPRGGNFARWCNPEFDTIVSSGETRRALMILARSAPFIPLARNTESFGVSRSVTGFEAPAPFVPPTLSAHRWALRIPT